MIHLAALTKMACRDVGTLAEIYFMNKPVYYQNDLGKRGHDYRGTGAQ